MHEEHVYNMEEQKPNEQKWLKTTQNHKSQISYVQIFQRKMHETCN